MDGEGQFKDRRVFERLATVLPVDLVDLDAGEELEAHTFDICAKGVGLISKSYLTPGNRMELWLKMQDGAGPFYTKGNVMWCRQQETGNYRSGIMLEKAELMGMARIFRS